MMLWVEEVLRKWACRCCSTSVATQESVKKGVKKVTMNQVETKMLAWKSVLFISTKAQICAADKNFAEVETFFSEKL